MEWRFKTWMLAFSLLIVNFCNAQLHGGEHCAAMKSISNPLHQDANLKSISGQEDYDVHFVRLDLELDHLSTQIDAGHAFIIATALNSVDEIVLELSSAMNVSYAFINDSGVIVQRFGDELKLISSQEIAAGSLINIDIFYNGTPVNVGNKGVLNQIANSVGASVTWSNSEPFYSKLWWPVKQVLTDKIDSSEVWLTIPNGVKGGSNGNLQNIVDLGVSKQRYEWKHNHNIAYYLISFAVGTYQEYSFYAPLPGTTDQVFIQNFLYDNPLIIPNLQNDIDETGDMMFEFSDLFGLYPFRDEKYGHCMAPIGGGMEHQTMTTQSSFNSLLTAHELGHQWFGNNVTCEDWGHIWLNEGLASYAEYLYLESINHNLAQQEMVLVHSGSMISPIGSVYVPVSEQDDRSRIFDFRLSYRKGSAIVHIARHWVNNDDLFFMALKSFQSKYANATASAEDFINEIELVTSVDMSRFLEHWYYGEGYPTYSGTFNNLNDGIVVELNQLVDLNSVTPFYKSHIELKVDFIDGTDTVLYVINNFNNEQYFFPINKTVDTITVDPNNWILNKEGSFLKDETMIFTSIQNRPGFDKTILEMYPNPTTGDLNIVLASEKEAWIEILDSTGKIVFDSMLFGGKNKISLNLAKGLYFIKCSVDGEFHQDRLVIN